MQDTNVVCLLSFVVALCFVCSSMWCLCFCHIPWDRCRAQSLFCIVFSFVVYFFLLCVLLICSNFGFYFSNKHLGTDEERDNEFFPIVSLCTPYSFGV